MLHLQAVLPDGRLTRIDPDDDVFVYGNNGASDFRISSAALRADDAIERERFWKKFQGVNESTALFLVRACDTQAYEEMNDVGVR